jgi:uncharacterized protein
VCRWSGLVIAFFSALVVLPTALSAQPRLIEYNTDRYIEVAGEGAIDAAPDFARLTLGVTTAAKDAGEALAANARAASALVTLVKSEGVAPVDIRTSAVSISPVFSQPSPAQVGVPTITGYRVSNTVTVVVRDLPRLGALIDKAVGAGANEVYGIAYGENDPSALLDKARPLAVADARRKAEIYATAGGAKIGRLMELTEEVGAQPPVGFATRAYVPGGAAATPIEAGEDKLRVTVTARFELTQ